MGNEINGMLVQIHGLLHNMERRAVMSLMIKHFGFHLDN